MYKCLVFLLLINEINYHSSNNLDCGDWIELYNNSAKTIVPAGWRFQDAKKDHQFIFPENLLLQPEKYLVLCQDTLAFRKVHGTWLKVIGNFNFGLANGGELLRIFDKTGVLVDSVRYSDDPPWPLEADGLGLTLELKNPNLDNGFWGHWRVSEIRGGTPGLQNSAVTLVSNDSRAPANFQLWQNYPNPFNATTTICYSLAQPDHLFLAVYNSQGQTVKIVQDGFQDKGFFSVTLDGTDAVGRAMSSGVYFYVLQSGEQRSQFKMVLVK